MTFLLRMRLQRPVLIVACFAAVAAAAVGASSSPLPDEPVTAGTPASLPVIPGPSAALSVGDDGSAVGEASPEPDFLLDEPGAAVDQSDPLDGDPLDGPGGVADGALGRLVGVSVAAEPYPIEWSDRSQDAAGARLAHDGDPTTVEEIAGARREVVLDLGTVRPVAAVRWLQRDAEPVVVQRSLLGGVWVTVERVESPDPAAWQALAVDWPARYVRLRFPTEQDAAIRLAEVEVYGPPADDERAERDDDRASDRAEREDERSAERAGRQRDRDGRLRAALERRQRAADRAGRQDQENVDRAPEPDGGLDPSTEGRADVVTEGCGDGTGDCRIEIDVSAGTAACDESGGSGNRAVGRNASAGEGGSCTRDASGGTVEIGDINP